MIKSTEVSYPNLTSLISLDPSIPTLHYLLPGKLSTLGSKEDFMVDSISGREVILCTIRK